MAFLDIGQATPGHTLVVPRKHSADIWSLSEDDAASVMRSVHRVGDPAQSHPRAPRNERHPVERIRRVQEVFHYHVHLVPRYGDDELVPPWRPTTPPQHVLTALQRRIRER